MKTTDETEGRPHGYPSYLEKPMKRQSKSKNTCRGSCRARGIIEFIPDISQARSRSGRVDLGRGLEKLSISA